MATMTLGVVQHGMTANRAENVEKACSGLKEAAARGAQVVLLPELVEGPYFPREIDDRFFDWATTLETNLAIKALAPLCKELGVAAPVSFFERDGQTGRYYNSVAMLDASGECLGVYRKTHVPDGPGYEEKHYFSLGDTGFKVFATQHGRIGVGICWDQWFPECARAMVLQGAEVLLYPTAIGSEPQPPYQDTRAPWRRVMQGHAVANTVPVAAANRVGDEAGQRFYGTSFICDGYGELLAELSDAEQGVALASLDRDHWNQQRHWMGLLRDRRPECYGALTRPGESE